MTRDCPKDLIEKVDWLYEHARRVMEEDPTRKRAWCVEIHFRDILTLRRIAKRLSDDGYKVTTQDSMQSVRIEGGKRQVIELGPTANVFSVGEFQAATVRKFVREMLDLAAKNHATCSDIEPMSIADMRMYTGLPSIIRTMPAAKGRLAHYTEFGLAPGASMVFVFGFEASNPAGTMAAMKKAGVKKIKRGPRNASWNVEYRVAGSNDDKALADAFKVAREVAKTTRCKLVGVDFEED